MRHTSIHLGDTRLEVNTRKGDVAFLFRDNVGDAPKRSDSDESRFIVKKGGIRNWCASSCVINACNSGDGCPIGTFSLFVLFLFSFLYSSSHPSPLFSYPLTHPFISIVPFCLLWVGRPLRFFGNVAYVPTRRHTLHEAFPERPTLCRRALPSREVIFLFFSCTFLVLFSYYNSYTLCRFAETKPIERVTKSCIVIKWEQGEKICLGWKLNEHLRLHNNTHIYCIYCLNNITAAYIQYIWSI